MLRRMFALIVAGFCLAGYTQAAAQDDKELSKEEKKALEDQAQEKLKEFKESLKGRRITEADVVSALENVGSMQHPKIIAFLSGYLRNPSPEIRREAARQIGKYEKDAKAAVMLVKTARSDKDPKTAAAMLEAAAEIGVRDMAKDIIKFFQNKDVVVAGAAIKACGQLKSRYAIQPLISLVRELEEIKEDRSYQQGVPNIPGVGGYPGGNNNTNNDIWQRKQSLLPQSMQALQDITGERFNKGTEWEQWWRKNSKKWKEPE